MRRSAYRRTAAPSGGNRRLLAVGAVIAALGLVVGVTTISSAAENNKPAGSGAGKVVNGQVILTDTCVDSKLNPHDGFQKGDRCVSTQFGEVSSAANNSSLLITQAPQAVNVNTPFTLKVSTRNLIRDRFLAAGQGGYYVESSVLQGGIERGHFHTACRMLTSTREAPDPSPVPAFFVATEDKKGGRAPDTVTIQVPGLPQEGTAQCASWAGDGSHRVPMMERANETPAIDAVRITVTANGGGQQGGNNGGNQGGNNGGQQGGNNGGQNGGNQGGNNGGQQGGNNGGQNGGNQGGNNGGQNGGQNGGGNTGGQNGGQQGGNTGGQNGGQQGGNTGGGQQGGASGNNGGNATTAPAPTGTAAQPDTKSDFTPKATITTTKPAAPPKSKPTETSTGKPASVRTTDSSDTESTESDPEPAATPKASKSAEAGDYTYSTDDGQPNSGEKPPTIDQVAAQTTTEQKSGVLALTGSNTIAFLGGAVVMMLGGLSLMALTRRRRPGTPWQ